MIREVPNGGARPPLGTESNHLQVVSWARSVMVASCFSVGARAQVGGVKRALNWTPGEHLTSPPTVDGNLRKVRLAQRFPAVC